MVFIHHGMQCFQHIEFQPIVAICKINILARNLRKGSIACRGDSLILLVNHHHTVVPGGVFITDGTAFVSGTVIYTDDLQIAVGLVYNAVQALPQIRGHVINGKNN